MSARIVVPPTRDLCHAVQLAALRRGWLVKCDGRWLWLVKSVLPGLGAGVLIGELLLLAGLWVTV